MEDIVEEIVGEIRDETDSTSPAARRLRNGDWYVRADISLADLADHGIKLPSDRSEDDEMATDEAWSATEPVVPLEAAPAPARRLPARKPRVGLVAISLPIPIQLPESRGQAE